MSKHEFDETNNDEDQMFDFLDNEVGGQPERKQRIRSKKEFVMPIIRKPVPISESGPASVSSISNVFGSGTGTEANTGAISFDDSLDFLDDAQALSSPKSSAENFNPTASTQASSDFGENWNEGLHVDAEHEEKDTSLVRKLLFIVACIAVIALLITLAISYSKSTNKTAASNDTGVGNDTEVRSTAADTDIIPATNTNESSVAPTLGQQFFSELETIEAYVAAGDLDAAEQTIASLDRAVYGYGAPEFSQIEEQIAQLRSGVVVGTDSSPVTRDDESAREAEQAAEAARVAEEARLEEAARLAEEARVVEAARTAEEARVAEADRTAAEALRREQQRAERQAALESAEQARVAQAALEAKAAQQAQALRAAEIEAEAQRAAAAARDKEAQFLAAQAERTKRAEIEAAKLVETETKRLADAQRLEEAANANAQAEEQRKAAAARRADARARVAAQEQAEADAQRSAQARLAEIDNERRIAERARIAEDKARADEVARQLRQQQQSAEITDLEFNAVSARFFELKKAIEREDIESVIALTQPSQSRVQDMLQLFANNASLKVRLGNVTSRNVDGGIVEGELMIEKMNRPLKVSSQRTANSWSLIKW